MADTSAAPHRRAKSRGPGGALLASLALLCAAGCANRESKTAAPGVAAQAAAPATVIADAQRSGVLMISSDLWGYLAPCGCSQAMRGGIARAAAQLDEVRARGAPVLFLDAGDALFGRATLTPAQVRQEELRAKALAEALQTMGLAAHAEGELDLVRGAAFTRSLGLPTVADGAPTLLSLGTRKVAVIAAGSVEAFPKAAAQARAEGASFVLGFLHQTLAQAQRAAQAPELGVDLIVASHAQGEFGAEDNRVVPTEVPVVQLQTKGRSMLRIDLSFLGQGAFKLVRTRADVERDLRTLEERIALTNKQVNQPGLRPETQALYLQKAAELVQRRAALLKAPLPTPAGQNSFGVRFVELESSLPDNPAVAAIVSRYDREVGELNLAWAKKNGRDCPAPEKGQAAYVGTAECKSCHAEADAFWETTKHAQAHATLVKVGKQNHLDCIGCHVTGMDAPGGVCRLDKVAGRENVGCEMCHGPGSLHADDPTPKNIRVRPGRDQCVGCHNPENSPHFDFATYLPKILGKGHGQK